MVKFNKELAKKVSLETTNVSDGPSDSQGIEIKSPGKMWWFTIKGITYDDITEVQTVALHDPDGEILDYVVQVGDKGLREKIFNKADDTNNTKLLIRCTNWFGTEFLWVASIKTKLSRQSCFKAVERGLDGQWIKAKWKSNSVGWQSWSHPGTERVPEWSKMDDGEIVDMVFDGRIIETLDHEALIRNVGGNV